jgi:hypothetical protein
VENSKQHEYYDEEGEYDEDYDEEDTAAQVAQQK